MEMTPECLDKQTRLSSFKAEGCFVCGEDDPTVIESHHVYPAEKAFTLSRNRICKKGMATLEAEIAKCVPLCANCHLRVHAGAHVIERDGTGRFVLVTERTTHEPTPYHCRPVERPRLHAGR